MQGNIFKLEGGKATRYKMEHKYRLIHLDVDDGKIFDIRQMTSNEAYNENANLLYSESRKRWERARERDRINVPRRYRRSED